MTKRAKDKWDRMAMRLGICVTGSTHPCSNCRIVAAALRRVDRAARKSVWRDAAALCSDYEQPSTTTKRKMLARSRMGGNV
jgi:hypothetical protein